MSTAKVAISISPEEFQKLVELATGTGGELAPETYLSQLIDNDYEEYHGRDAKHDLDKVWEPVCTYSDPASQEYTIYTDSQGRYLIRDHASRTPAKPVTKDIAILHWVGACAPEDWAIKLQEGYKMVTPADL